MAFGKVAAPGNGGMSAANRSGRGGDRVTAKEREFTSGAKAQFVLGDLSARMKLARFPVRTRDRVQSGCWWSPVECPRKKTK